MVAGSFQGYPELCHLPSSQAPSWEELGLGTAFSPQPLRTVRNGGPSGEVFP